MKFNWVLSFSRGFVILICCWDAIAFGSTASVAAPDTANWVQLSPTTSPPARSYLAMTYDAASGKVIVFGGFDGNGYLNDTWTFDGVTWTLIATDTPPPARAAARWHPLILFATSRFHPLHNRVG